MKNFCEFLCAAMVLESALLSAVEAKGMGGPICGRLMFRQVEVVVQAHIAPGSESAIIVDKSYYGPYQAGDRVPVLPDAMRGELIVPGGLSQPEMLLVLTHFDGDYETSKGWDMLFARDLLIDFWSSRRLSNGRVYFWSGNTKTASYRFWSYFTNTAALTRDETHPNLAALESDTTLGLARHKNWWQAKAATDPAVKLALLRPFLLPGGKFGMTDYDVWSCLDGALEEIEETGPASIPFLNELLTEPSFQDSYAKDDWPGYGTGERDKVKRSLALVEARMAASPQEKLAKLRPVFDTIDFWTTAGFDRHGAVEIYLDRALEVAASVDAADAKPFLQSLLALSQFQEVYEPIGQTSEGHEMRVKIQAALAGLR